MLKIRNPLKIFFETLVVTLVLSFVFYQIFDFEKTVIFTICLLAAIISGFCVSIENTIIITDKTDKVE